MLNYKLFFLLFFYLTKAYAQSYFDHTAHGMPNLQEMPLCKDGIDNDFDGKKDEEAQGCNPKTIQSLSCKKCHQTNKDQSFKIINHQNCEPCHQLDQIIKNKNTSYCKSCHNGPPPSKSYHFPPFRQSIRRSRFNVSDMEDIPEGGWSPFGISKNFDHKQHAKIGGVCHQCHIETSKQSQKIKAKVSKQLNDKRGHQFDGYFVLNGHEGCFKCHQKLDPKPDDCMGCHEILEKTTFEINPNRTLGQFDHQAHKDQLGELPCKKCHSNVEEDQHSLVVLPKKPDCLSCHSGEIAFDMRENNCNKCHKK